MIEIRQYIDRLGRNPFERWVRALDGVTRARVDETIDKVEQGNLTMMKGGAGRLRVAAAVWSGISDLLRT